MPITYETFERVALEDESGHWELDCGRLRQKPPMTQEHNESNRALYRALDRQLDPAVYDLRGHDAYLRVSASVTYQPDIFVLPQAYRRSRRDRGESGLEIYAEPMPLVVEVWSPSTGTYDLRTKLPDYQARGDAEIWLIHPYERWLRAWRRQPDGTYVELVFTGGATIEPV